MKIGPLEINLQRVFLFVVIGLALLLVMNFNARLGVLRKNQALLNDELATATANALTQTALQNQLEYANSDKAAEDWARTEGGMALPGDSPVLPQAVQGSTPILKDTLPTPAPADITRWEVWLELLFGDRFNSGR